MIPYPLNHPHALDVSSIASKLNTSIHTGLAEEEAKDRNIQFGLNAYQVKKGPGLLSVFISQFKNPMVYLLFVGSAVSFYFEDITDGIAILSVIFINAIL